MGHSFTPQPYNTSKQHPEMVQYIERHLIRTSMWLDWIVLKQHLLSFTDLVQHRTGTTKRRAHLMIWNAFVAAIDGDGRSPVYFDYLKIVDEIDESKKPIFIGRLKVAALIHQDGGVKKAELDFQQWLKEGENNIFGEYQLNPDFTTTKLSSDSD